MENASDGPVRAERFRGFWARFVPVAAVLAWSGCAQIQQLGIFPTAPKYMGTTATSFMKRIKDERDPNVRYLAYSKLADPGCYESPGQKAEAVKLLISNYEKGGEPLASRAAIIKTLGQLRDPLARDLVLRTVSESDPILRTQACRALGRVGREEDATVLTREMTVDTLIDCRVAAIEAIGELKPKDRRIPVVLVAGMQHDEPAIRLASLKALRSITGEDLGVEVGPWAKRFDPTSTLAQASDPKPGDAAPSDAQTKPASFPWSLPWANAPTGTPTSKSRWPLGQEGTANSTPTTVPSIPTPLLPKPEATGTPDAATPQIPNPAQLGISF